MYLTLLYKFQSGQKGFSEKESFMDIKVMSYNLHSCIGMDQVVDMERLADFLKKCDADIIGLQELSINHPYLPGIDQLEDLAKRTGYTPFFAQTLSREREAGLFHYGIGVLTRLPAEKIAQLELPNEDKCEPRTAIIIRAEKEGKKFYFANTHLAYDPPYPHLRKAQGKTITDYIKNNALFPAVITGDFNATPDSSCLEEMQKCWTFTDLDILTCPADNPDTKIDYIGFTPGNAFTFRDYQVIEEKVISDHRPLTVILES